MPRLVLFDLDGTLLPIDSDHAWNEFMVGLGWVDAAGFRAGNERFYADYLEGRLDIAAYIAFASAPLRGRSEVELGAAQRRFMREVIAPNLTAPALRLVDSHRERGDVIAIATSTNDFVVAPIVAAFGLPPQAMIATRLERDADGSPTGRIAGVPAFREGKVARVRQWLADRGEEPGGFAAVVAYSDSANDLPLLGMASEPVATNPSAELAAIARARGWPILDLFSTS